MPTYNSYHSNLLLLYKLNALPDQFKNIIPSSTLSSWKNQDVGHMIGATELGDTDVQVLGSIAKNKKLLLVARAVFTMFNTISQILQQAKEQSALFYANRNEMLEKVKPILGLKRVLRWMGVSQAKLYYWMEKKRCALSPFQLCQIKHPSQLTQIDIETIKAYHNDVRFINWSTLSIYYQAMREKATAMSLATWYKYVHRLGIRNTFFKLKKATKIGIRSQKPFQVLHMDVTIFRSLDGTKIYIYFVVDNYSRSILSWIASKFYSSQMALTVLKEALAKNTFQQEMKLITDGGPENQGAVSKFINSSDGLSHLIAQKDILLSNSMVESVIKHMKYLYLFKTKPKDFDETILHLAQAIPDYQNKPHGALFGLTPEEVLNGKIPDKNLFFEQKKESRIARIKQNQEMKCCI